ncbi:hypothetical protein C8J44_1102 [Sphingomonas sp. PP-CE-3A-406]|nr:hypothetical protein C8J44_1102 [Sphingomonas sp. PP-CE-3A-406]
MIASVKGRKKQEINEMTIQHSIDIMQAWTHGLRIAMGYPEYAPIGNPVAFASGGRKNFAKALEIAAIVEQTGRDMVFVQFGLPIVDGPIGVSLAARATLHVNWHANVQLYLASDDSSVEILADTHRWSVGPRNVLTASALPPRNRIKRGVERAHRRWREVAERVHGVELIGSIFVPTGGSYADGVPMETLSEAA